MSSSEMISLSRKDIAAWWTVSCSPETRGCHHSRSLPSAIVRYPQLSGSQFNSLMFSGGGLLSHNYNQHQIDSYIHYTEAWLHLNVCTLSMCNEVHRFNDHKSSGNNIFHTLSIRSPTLL